MCDGEGSPDPRRRPPGTSAQHLGGRPIGHQGGELRPQSIQLRGRADMRRPPQACLGHAASNTALAGQPEGDLAEQCGDRVLTIILDPADRATAAAARRMARSVPPRLRSDELLLDASQELLTLRQGQAQGGQIREVVRSGDLHDLRAAFVARGPDAYQLHDPGHAVSAHRLTSRKVPSWTRTPNLAAVPSGTRSIPEMSASRPCWNPTPCGPAPRLTIRYQ